MARILMRFDDQDMMRDALAAILAPEGTRNPSAANDGKVAIVAAEHQA